MKRTPSLHISKTDLVKVLKKILDGDNSIEFNPKSLATEILVRSKPYSITNRSISISNQYQERKINRVLKAGLQEAYLFNKLLSMIRKQRKHRGIQEIKESDRNWAMIKEVTALAVTFCNDFDLKPEEGFKEYINIALDRMNKFSLNRFPMMHQNICMDYEAKDLILKDENLTLTAEAHNYYCNLLFQKVGVPDTYRENPTKYICFVKAVELCVKKGVKVTDYIDAQFDGLAWTSNPPDPSQLLGENAWHRYTKYAYANSINNNPKKVLPKNTEKLNGFIEKYGNEIFSD